MSTRDRLSRIVHGVASAALWVLAAVGLVGGTTWVLNVTGLVQPLIVVSGSMEPTIRTGDLVIATAVQAEDLAVGQVATIRSELTGKLVTHRVIGVSRTGDSIVVSMQGDANAVADPEGYALVAGERVWKPWFTIPGGGYVAANLMRPSVLVPLVGGVLALLALALFPSRRPGDEGSKADSEATGSAASGADPLDDGSSDVASAEAPRALRNRAVRNRGARL